MNTTAMRRCGTRIALAALLGALAVGCGEITELDAPDAGGSDGTGGHVLAQMGVGGSGGATEGTGGAAIDGTGGVRGSGGRIVGVGGISDVTGTGGMPSVGAGGVGGTVEFCLPNQPCVQIPYCPTTGAPPHDSPCPKDSLCTSRSYVCNSAPYAPGYDLSVLPCMGSGICVSSCESCHSW